MNAPLDSRQLRAFVTLARTGSFTQTARELHLTQSAISHSMKALESDVGCRLLDRLGKKVALTQAGEQLLQHAQKILSEMDTARASLGKLGKWGRGRLRLDPGETKNNEDRNFPFTARLREIIEQQLERTRALEKATGCIIPSLFHRNGKPIKPFQRCWLIACIKAGLGTEVRSAKGKLIKNRKPDSP